MESWTGISEKELSMLLGPVGVGAPNEMPGFDLLPSFNGCLVCIVSHFTHWVFKTMILASRTMQYRLRVVCIGFCW